MRLRLGRRYRCLFGCLACARVLRTVLITCDRSGSGGVLIHTRGCCSYVILRGPIACSYVWFFRWPERCQTFDLDPCLGVLAGASSGILGTMAFVCRGMLKTLKPGACSGVGGNPQPVSGGEEGAHPLSFGVRHRLLCGSNELGCNGKAGVGAGAQRILLLDVF